MSNIESLMNSDVVIQFLKSMYSLINLNTNLKRLYYLIGNLEIFHHS
jgi:hypothetical protein